MREPPPLRGEVWTVFTPNQPADPHQPRPALIISADERNLTEDDVIVVPIFTRGAIGPTHVPIRAGIGGLDHESIIFCEEITTIDVECLAAGPLGERVPDPLLRRVVRAARIALGDVPRPGD